MNSIHQEYIRTFILNVVGYKCCILDYEVASRVTIESVKAFYKEVQSFLFLSLCIKFTSAEYNIVNAELLWYTYLVKFKLHSSV